MQIKPFPHLGNIHAGPPTLIDASPQISGGDWCDQDPSWIEMI